MNYKAYIPKTPGAFMRRRSVVILIAVLFIVIAVGLLAIPTTKPKTVLATTTKPTIIPRSTPTTPITTTTKQTTTLMPITASQLALAKTLEVHTSELACSEAGRSNRSTCFHFTNGRLASSGL